jgi:transporter family-2 protein
MRVEGVMPEWRAPASWLYFAGGCLGSVYVTAAILLTPRIGAAAVMAFSVAGQLTAGLIIDRIGFMGVAVRELSAGRIVGALLLCAGVVMIRMF